MTELSAPLRRDLATLRRRSSPPPGAEQRVLLAVEAAGAGLDEPEPEPELTVEVDGAGELGRAPDSLTQLVWAAKSVAATLALAGAGLLATRAVVLALDEPATPARIAVETPQPERALAPSSPAPPASPPPPSRELAKVAAPSSAARATTTTPLTGKPRSTAGDSPGVEAEPEDTLAAELALIESARTASDSNAALGRLRAHAQRFPDGVLSTERDLLLVETLCALERVDEARALDTTLAAKLAASPQRAKLRKRCPALDRTDQPASGHD